jgi:predicted transcriptional regulator
MKIYSKNTDKDSDKARMIDEARAITEGLQDAEAGRVVDGDEALNRIKVNTA